MNLLYLHGLDSRPNAEKIAILESAGHAVTAPHIDYRAFVGDLTLFRDLEKTIVDNDIETIVGSSFGGYMGFFLSEKLIIPAVLFNPALHLRNIDVPIITRDTDTEKTIFLGTYDDVIVAQETKEWINYNDYKNIILKELETGHVISTEEFKICLDFI